MFGSFDVPGLNVLTFLTYRYFAYFFGVSLSRVGGNWDIRRLSISSIRYLLVISLVIFVFCGALNVVVWRYQWKHESWSSTNKNEL